MALVSQVAEQGVEFDRDEGRFASFHWLNKGIDGQAGHVASWGNDLDRVVLTGVVCQLNDTLREFAFWKAWELNLVFVRDDGAFSHIDKVGELAFTYACLTSDQSDEDIGFFKDLSLTRSVFNLKLIFLLGQDSACTVVSCNADFLRQTDKTELLGKERVVLHGERES